MGKNFLNMARNHTYIFLTKRYQILCNGFMEVNILVCPIKVGQSDIEKHFHSYETEIIEIFTWVKE